MRRLFFRFLGGWCASAAIVAASLGARAVPAQTTAAPVNEIAPGLALPLVHRLMGDELSVLVSKLPAETQRRITGVYMAFDTSMTDVSATAACDDDGDYVVVTSDALLVLVEYVAQAKATDEVFGTHRQDDYATFLAGSQLGGARLLPPPPGFFDPAQAKSPAKLDLERARFREALAFLIADELEHILQGDITCPNPTATHEHGDDEWTREERDHALTVALKVYTGPRVLAADGTGTARLLDAGRTEEGGVTLLSVFGRVEQVPESIRARNLVPWSYLKLHPDSDVRTQVVRAAANQWRRLLAAAGPKGG